MSTMQAIATLLLFCAAEIAAAEPGTRVNIDVSKNGAIEAIQTPDKLTAAILEAVEHSQASSQDNPANDWKQAFKQPNWIHLSFDPGKVLRSSGGRQTVTEILMVFPTSDAGRRWPDYILLKSDAGIQSRAKWIACDMRAIVSAAGFAQKSEAPPFNSYCADGR